MGSYGYPDGVALRERVVLLREEELLLVGVGLAVVDAEVEDPLLLSLFLKGTKNEIEFRFVSNISLKCAYFDRGKAAAYIRT